MTSSDTPRTADSFDFQAARRFLAGRRKAKAEARLALWRAAAADAEAITSLIARKYRPKRIIQWGSVLAPEHFSEASDIDLAVEGVDPIAFLRLCADAEDMTRFPLDLLRWESVNAHFQRIISMKGRVIYEA